MTIYWILLVLGAVLLCLYIRAKLRKYDVKELLLKTFTSVCFCFIAIFLAYLIPWGTPARAYAFFVIGGLLMGLLGDVWLDLKFIYPKDDQIYTFAGFYSFFAGHVLFVLGMIINYGDPSRLGYIIIPIIIGFAVGIINGFLGKVMKLDYGIYRPIVMGYGGILFSMTLLAGSLAWMHGFQFMTLNFMFVGGIFFLISDLVLSQTYFAGNESKGVIIANYLTYYPAQFIIASSLLFIR